MLGSREGKKYKTPPAPPGSDRRGVGGCFVFLDVVIKERGTLSYKFVFQTASKHPCGKLLFTATFKPPAVVVAAGEWPSKRNGSGFLHSAGAGFSREASSGSRSGCR